MVRSSSRRSGLVTTRRIAKQGTGTWGILEIMRKFLVDNPGDVDGASQVAQTKGRNLGLCYGPVWDEHGDEISKVLYNRYMQPYEQTPREVPEDIRKRHPRPKTDAPPPPTDEREGEDAPEFIPPEPTLRPPEIVMGAAAKKYYLAGGNSQDLEIGLWSREQIDDKTDNFINIVSGVNHSLGNWQQLQSMVPPGGIVKDYVTNEQLEALDL